MRTAGSPARMTLGSKLKALRQQTGLTQVQLAEEIQVSQSLVSHVERDRGAPSYDVIARWVDRCRGEIIIRPAAKTTSERLAAALVDLPDVDQLLLIRLAEQLKGDNPYRTEMIRGAIGGLVPTSPAIARQG